MRYATGQPQVINPRGNDVSQGRLRDLLSPAVGAISRLELCEIAP
ncbi:hypothetical protein [Saccharopolyspora sp. NPDC002376]